MLSVQSIGRLLAAWAAGRRRRVAGKCTQKGRRRLAAACALAVLGLAGAGWHFSQVVAHAAAGHVFTVDEVPARQVALVFGAGVFPNGDLSAPLSDRVRVAAELYRLGKVRKLLMSGDNSRRAYDESTAMKQYAVTLGVRPDDVVLDYAGFRTYDSCYRARAVFQIHSAVLVTQRYHLARAIYTCSGLGVDSVGVAADQQQYQRALWYRIREELARARAYVQVRVTRPKPHFLGPQIPIV